MTEWISVESELPEERVDVIVYCDGCGGSFLITAKYMDGLWVDTWSGGENMECVTHWMPLPEPPKDA